MTVSKFLYCLMLQDKMAQRSSFSVEGAEKKTKFPRPSVLHLRRAMHCEKKSI